jgi:hypothetical protein
MLYPYRKLGPFSEKNVIPAEWVRDIHWLQAQVKEGAQDFIEQDVNGDIHFSGRFRNSQELRTALGQEPGISEEELNTLCAVFEDLFRHRQFTGRSGAMYKYEGLGCIYWHMVSKLLLATSEVINAASQGTGDEDVLNGLLDYFDRIQAGLGLHKTPAEYGAIPLDPYSHTTGFSGVQQPGMTGQVKEDIITRFAELGVNVENGEVVFSPVKLRQGEFINAPGRWEYQDGASHHSLDMAAGSLGFTLCGVPVVYRLAETAVIRVDCADGSVSSIDGKRLGKEWSASLFRREGRINSLQIDVPRDALRD